MRSVEPVVDLERLHVYLWEHRAKGDKITMTQADLAERLQISRPAAGKALRKLVEGGQLQSLPGRSDYLVSEPPDSGSPGGE